MAKRRTAKSNPLDPLVASLTQTPDQLQALRKQAASQRVAQLEARTRAAARPLEASRERLEKGPEQRAEELAAPVEGGFVVYGRVVDAESGGALAGVRVEVLDRDPLHDDLLGEVRTDALGFYRLEYRRRDFRDLFERRPETYIRVVDEAGETLFTSDRSFRHKAGKVAAIHAAVDGSRVPEALERGKLHGSRATAALGGVERQLKALDGRLTVLTGRFGTTGAPAPEPVRPAPAKKPAAKAKPAKAKAAKKPAAKAKPAKKPAAKAKAAKKPASPPAAEPAPPVTAVRGVGSKLASRLARAGVADAAELADTARSRLTEILKVAAGRVEKIRLEARRLLDRGD